MEGKLKEIKQKLTSLKVQLLKLTNFEQRIYIDDRTAQKLGYKNRKDYIEKTMKHKAERFRSANCKIENNKLIIRYGFGIYSDRDIYELRDAQKAKELLQQIRELEEQESRVLEWLVEHRPIE